MEGAERNRLGEVAVEFGCRHVGAAAGTELRRSRRTAVERRQKRCARAPADHGEVIRVPGRVGGQAREAVDGKLKFGRRR
jgi:hypothetical protein